MLENWIWFTEHEVGKLLLTLESTVVKCISDLTSLGAD